MNFSRPKSLGKTIEVKASNRPIKVVYIVPYEESSVNHMIVDAVFYESYTRWAGAYTLIVPSNSKEFLYPAYEAWLEFFDPDFIYTYVQLEEHLIYKIDRLCSPIALLQNKISNFNSEELCWNSFIPDWGGYFTPVSSMTTVPSPHAHYPFFMQREPDAEITVLTQYRDGTKQRLLSDNFGTAFDIYNVTHAIPGLFRTLCLAPPDLPNNVIVGTERCTSITDMLSEISSRRAMPIARFAMAHSEAIPRVEPYEWAHSFNIFIGKTLIDRIHFWNARHFTPSFATTSGGLILEKEFFEEPDLVIQLGKYLNNNNFLGWNSDHHAVSIRSYSLSEQELLSIRDKLQKHTYNSVFVTKSFNAP